MSQDLYEPLAPAPPPIPAGTMMAPGVPPFAYAYPLPPAKPRIWTGFTAFGIYLVLTLVVGVGLVMAQMLISGRMEITTELVLGLMAFNVIVAGCVAVAGARFSPERMADRLQIRPASMTALSTIVGILTTCSIGAVFTAGFAMLTQVPELARLFEMPDMLSGLSPDKPGMLALGYLVIALGAGLGEELLFRGYMQSRFVKRMGFYGALFTTAGLFGLAHANLVQTPFAFVMGLFVGHLAYRTGSILPAILCHIANNAMAVTLSIFGFIPMTLGPQLTMLIVALVTMTLGWFLMTRITPSRTPMGSPSPQA